MYNPRTARWNALDPLAKKYTSNSPYSFALNNPIYFVDANGKEVFAHDAASQQLTLNTMKYMFGSSKGFSFDAKGKLSFTGSTDKFSFYQKVAFNYLNQTVLTSKTAVTINANTNSKVERGTQGNGKRDEPEIAPMIQNTQDGDGYTYYQPGYTTYNGPEGSASVLPLFESHTPGRVEILISNKATNKQGALMTTNGMENFPPEHQLTHELGHGIMDIIINEMGGTFNGVDYKSLSESEQRDFAIRFSNTILKDKGGSLETGAGQHDRAPNEAPIAPDVAPLKKIIYV